MSEWFKEHAWKSDRFTCADAQQNPPTHVRSSSSRYKEVLRDAPVTDDVHRGFRGVCDTVLTQSKRRFPATSMNRDAVIHRQELKLDADVSVPVTLRALTDSSAPIHGADNRTIDHRCNHGLEDFGQPDNGRNRLGHVIPDDSEADEYYAEQQPETEPLNTPRRAVVVTFSNGSTSPAVNFKFVQ